jgi:hypothetical protein
MKSPAPTMLVENFVGMLNFTSCYEPMFNRPFDPGVAEL